MSTQPFPLDKKKIFLKPEIYPEFPFFSSGPTKKHPGYSIDQFADALTSRSHRAPDSLKVFEEIFKKIRTILAVPDTYKILIVPGSATGATECALWSFLGARGVDVFAWEVFSKMWVADITTQLKIQDRRVFEADFGQLPDLSAYTPDRDAVFVWNGTTSGVCVPHLDWIPDIREGLTICDVTSAIFCVTLEWNKLDVTAFSWQKGLGGEAGHGMLILSPRALERLKTHTPSWAIPRLFRLKNEEGVDESLFNGTTINTPSLLCVHDFLKALEWAEDIGGIEALTGRCEANFTVIREWIESSDFVYFTVQDKTYRSPISVTFRPNESCFSDDMPTVIRRVSSLLASENVAHDIINHGLAPIAFRLWCGPTIETNDLKILTSWLNYALNTVQNGGL